MIYIVTGGRNSGKSRYAEEMAERAAGEMGAGLIYLATLADRSSASRRKIEKHCRQRAGKGFITIEQSRDLDVLAEDERIRGSVILLEDMTNLLAGYRYQPGVYKDSARITEEIKALAGAAATLIIVANEVTGENMEIYEAETKNFARELSYILGELAEQAESVSEIVFGNAVVTDKGKSEKTMGMIGLHNSASEKAMETRGLHNNTGEQVFFVTGGAYSGKTKYAKEHYIRECYVNTLEGLEKAVTAEKNIMIDDLQNIIYEQLEAECEVEDYWREILPHLKRCSAVVICREMGCGLLPMDEKQRKYQEICGKTAALIAGESTEIIRMITGVHQRIR